MKKLVPAALLTLAALVAASVIAGAPAQATTPQTVTITLLRNGPPDRAPVGWSSTGAFTDAGSWTIDTFVCGSCVPSPVAGAPFFDTTETSTRGSFEMLLHAEFNLLEAPGQPALWEIVRGSGAYANLRGQGTYTVTIDSDGVRHIVCTGEVNFD